MDREAWRATVHREAKESGTSRQLTLKLFFFFHEELMYFMRCRKS